MLLSRKIDTDQWVFPGRMDIGDLFLPDDLMSEFSLIYVITYNYVIDHINEVVGLNWSYQQNPTIVEEESDIKH
jgi:hypothetical protein